ncbi:antitoxin [Pasteurellaceae bacterium RH1A]|nr:antitoxin [Pasteurellaceae bacterium RH1A]
MLTGKLRQQGGAMVLTVPNAIVAQMGWQVGNLLDIESQGETVVLRSAKRKPRGRKSLDELLAGIDCQEIQTLNEEMAEYNALPAKGNEVW